MMCIFNLCKFKSNFHFRCIGLIFHINVKSSAYYLFFYFICMIRILKSHSLSSGFALFSMFFGAGNLIFPLAIGAYAGDKSIYAMLGLLITAVLVPFLGVIAILIHDGDYHRFFGRLGTWPGYLLAISIIALIGPFGCTPRCVALSFSTVKAFVPTLNAPLFNGVFCALIFLFTLRKNRTVELLGKILTPILLLGLGFIIFRGFFAEGTVELCAQKPPSLFFHGLVEGYNTMDLLAAFFFSSTVIAMLKNRSGDSSSPTHFKRTLKAAGIGAFILAAVYLCFSYIAAMHSASLEFAPKDRLLTALAMKVAGPFAGLAVSLTVVITCLTTAIALISVFSDFIQKNVFRSKVGYIPVLIGSVLITFGMSSIEFQGITAFLAPVLQVFYPSLILLTLLSLFAKYIPQRVFRPLAVVSFFVLMVIYFFI